LMVRIRTGRESFVIGTTTGATGIIAGASGALAETGVTGADGLTGEGALTLGVGLLRRTKS
jgi:ABC-type hemin transport system substrate-binding protein